MPTRRKRPRFQPPQGDANWPSLLPTDPDEVSDARLLDQVEALENSTDPTGQDNPTTRSGQPLDAYEAPAGSIDQQLDRKRHGPSLHASQSGCIGPDGRITPLQSSPTDPRNPLGLVPRQRICGVWR